MDADDVVAHPPEWTRSAPAVPPVRDGRGSDGDPRAGLPGSGLLEYAVARCARGRGPRDMKVYLERMLGGGRHSEIIGPLKDGGRASGCLLWRGRELISWGPTDEPEMSFSVSKIALACVAGVAFDRALIRHVEDPVSDAVDVAPFGRGALKSVTWQHLLQQTSGWSGTLWGKPTSAGRKGGTASTGHAPGAAWEYNDVRVNLLALALTHVWGESLHDVLSREVLGPLGGSGTWRWHGYKGATTMIEGREVEVVSGGGRWGAGLWIATRDLALLGLLLLKEGTVGSTRVLNREWVRAMQTPCAVKPDYGYLCWLNRQATVFPLAPSTGFCGLGHGDAHLLWIDPGRDVVMVSRWGKCPSFVLFAQSLVIPPL